MPKKDSDYSNTIIYKIYCKDENIKDMYVGHTINFTQRKYSHVKACNNLNNSVRIYKTIRANGGWENWNMVEIATYRCKDLTEARIKENEHYNELQASLNSSQPYVNREVNKEVNKVIKKYTCSICNLEFTNFGECNYHVKNCIIISTIRNNITEENLVNENNVNENNIKENNIIEENLVNKNNIVEENLVNKNNQIEDNLNNQNDNLKDDININNFENFENYDGVYTCNYCNYFTNKRSNYEKHLLTSKHKINSNGIHPKEYNCKICKKKFNSNNSLWKHNKRLHSNNKLTENDKDEIILCLLKQNAELIKRR